MNNKSFTLIELLVVIVIIGILAGVIMISTSSSIDKANIAKLKVFEESVANDLSANMVSRWKLDEVNGASTPDAWGTNTGTLIGTIHLPIIKTMECVTGNCLFFDGEEDYVNLGNDPSLQEPSFTVTFWVRQSDNSIRNIINKQYLPANGTGWRIFQNGVNFEFDGYGEIGNLTVTHNVGNWLHITASYDINSHTMKLFKNGVLGDIESAVTINNSNDKPLLLSTHSSFFKGNLDDVRFYNSELSSSQIKQNYIAGLDSLLSNGNISKEDYNRRINELAYE